MHLRSAGAHHELLCSRDTKGAFHGKNDNSRHHGGGQTTKSCYLKMVGVAPGGKGSSCFAVAAFATTCGQLHVCGECCQAAREQAQGALTAFFIKDSTVKIAEYIF